MEEPSKRPLAPGDLRLVQLFINTNDREEGTDAFDDAAAIRTWMRSQGFDAPGVISDRERQRVLAVREALRSLAGANNGRRAPKAQIDSLNDAAARLSVRIRFGADGQAGLQAQAKGVDGMLSRLLAIVAAAQGSGNWQRLKACSRDKCQWVFYDRSRNRSGAWCEMGICGAREKSMTYYRRHRGAAKAVR